MNVVDTIRHYLYTIFNPWSFGSNISAEVVQIVVIGALILVFRKPAMRAYERMRHHVLGRHLIAMEERLKEDIHGHHEDSVAILKEHVTSELLAQDKRLATLVKPTPPPRHEL